MDTLIWQDQGTGQQGSGIYMVNIFFLQVLTVALQNWILTFQDKCYCHRVTSNGPAKINRETVQETMEES